MISENVWDLDLRYKRIKWRLILIHELSNATGALVRLCAEIEGRV